jgi:nucleotide-binding universal stress UspA family protein
MAVMEGQVAISLKTILMATDYSRPAEKAAGYARALARRFGATLEMVHVVDASRVPTDAGEAARKPLDDSPLTGSKDLEKFLCTFLDGGVQTKSFSIESADPARGLLETAQRRHSDLIVAGTQSKSMVGKLLLGSTAESLIRSAECPVLTVGPKVPQPPHNALVFERIVYATDFSGQAGKAASYALALAEVDHARLCCCYVDSMEVDDPAYRAERIEALKQTLRDSLPQSASNLCLPEFYIEHGEVAEAILRLADRVDADLIVLGARKASLWIKYVERGLTPSLLAEAKCPVLTVC